MGAPSRGILVSVGLAGALTAAGACLGDDPVLDPGANDGGVDGATSGADTLCGLLHGAAASSRKAT